MISQRGNIGSQSGGESGPAISAVPFRDVANGRTVPLLNHRERELLAGIASMVSFCRGTTIYREGDRTDFLYNIVQGVVKTFRTSLDGNRHVVAFLFADDLFGLAEEGVYVNETQAVTAVTAYRMPIDAFIDLTCHEPLLDHSLLLKLTHELREDQRHGLILARHDALGKIALFVQMLEHLDHQRGRNADEIYLPMRRSDVADYIGITLPAVSRAFRALTSRNIVRFSDRCHLRITDPARLEELAAHEARGQGGSRGDDREMPVRIRSL